MPFFDAHLHPLFKPYMSNGKHGIWKKLSGLGPLKSQSSMDQIVKGKLDLMVVAICPMEKPFSTAVLTQMLGPILSPFNKDKINDIINSNYFTLFLEELALIQKNTRKSAYNLLKKPDGFVKGKPNLVFSIEGAHSLKGVQSVTENLLKLKQKKDVRFFSMNLAHLTQEDFSSHAFGAKMFKGNDEFKPNAKGITPEGWELVHLAHDQNKGQRILIDVKHMSLFARKEYFQYAKENNIPIFASHIGVTGFPSKKIHEMITGPCVIKDGFVEVKYKRVAGIGKTTFNPWSINFYDEEIKAIITSGGLIGLNMDQRIQGFGKVKGEYFSEKEFRHVVRVNNLEFKLKEFVLQEPPEEKLFGLNQKRHLEHMCNAILHIVRVGGKKAWKHICFGSDFDGLVNPVNCCRNATEYGKMKKMMLDVLPEMIKKGKKKYPGTNYFEGDIVERVEEIFYQNGFNFIMKNI